MQLESFGPFKVTVLYLGCLYGQKTTNKQPKHTKKKVQGVVCLYFSDVQSRWGLRENESRAELNEHEHKESWNNKMSQNEAE
jgi:hypothetical protein